MAHKALLGADARFGVGCPWEVDHDCQRPRSPGIRLDLDALGGKQAIHPIADRSEIPLASEFQ